MTASDLGKNTFYAQLFTKIYQNLHYYPGPRWLSEAARLLCPETQHRLAWMSMLRQAAKQRREFKVD